MALGYTKETSLHSWFTSKGEGASPAATSPATWAMSAISQEPFWSAMARNLGMAAVGRGIWRVLVEEQEEKRELTWHNPACESNS